VDLPHGPFGGEGVLRIRELLWRRRLRLAPDGLQAPDTVAAELGLTGIAAGTTHGNASIADGSGEGGGLQVTVNSPLIAE
jgi:hypothetical protein